MQYAPYFRVVEGSDAAVLMIHGIAGTPAHFRFLLPEIPENWSIYNILLPGHGKGVREFSRASMGQWKQQVSEQLDEILRCHSRVLIVAHSMGTLFAIQEAIRHEGKIGGLFLLNVPLNPMLPLSTARNSLKLALDVKAPGAAAEEMRAGCGIHLERNLVKYLGWVPRFLELFREVRCVKKLLPQLDTPTWAYQSRKDELVAFRAVKHLENHPSIRLRILQHSGHFAYREDDPEFLRGELAQMLKQFEN